MTEWMQFPLLVPISIVIGKAALGVLALCSYVVMLMRGVPKIGIK